MPSTELDTPPSTHFDVLIVGAGLAGICTGLLIKRRNPQARVLLVEKRYRLAESGNSYALAGVSAIFMSLGLGASESLGREHLPRHGEHLWFAREASASLAEMTEIGADEFASHPAQHVDLARLTCSLLKDAEREGLQVAFGVEAIHAKHEWPHSSLRVRGAGQTREFHARWIIDAGGRTGFLSRVLDLQQPLETPSGWNAVARWTGLAAFDSLRAGGQATAPLAPFSRSREFATHHFFGLDWRASLVPHVEGGASLHLNMEWDSYAQQRGQRSALEAYSQIVRSRPGLNELLRAASLDAERFSASQERDWVAGAHCARGWFLVGEAAGTPAPIFGGGLDDVLRMVWNAADIISLDLGGDEDEAQVVERLRRCNLREQQYDRGAQVSLRSTTRALCGDAALCSVAYGLRRGLQSLEMQRIARDLGRLSMLSWHGLWQGRVRATIYSRLRELARRRLASGHYADHNDHGQLRLGPGEGTLRPLAAAFWQWIQLEYASLREALSPVPGDVYDSPGVQVQERAAAFRSQLATQVGSRESEAPGFKGIE